MKDRAAMVDDRPARDRALRLVGGVAMTLRTTSGETVTVSLSRTQAIAMRAQLDRAIHDAKN